MPVVPWLPFWPPLVLSLLVPLLFWSPLVPLLSAEPLLPWFPLLSPPWLLSPELLPLSPLFCPGMVMVAVLESFLSEEKSAEMRSGTFHCCSSSVGYSVHAPSW